MRMDVKTNTDVDRQCQYGLEGEGTVGGGDAISGCVEATCQKHRPPRTSVGKCALEEEMSSNKVIGANIYISQII